MDVLITGAASVIGATVGARLTAAGHRVVAVVQQPELCPDDRIEWVCADLGDPLVGDLANDADVVVHLGPLEPDAPRSAGLKGLVTVSDAAAHGGARLMFVSHAAGDPDLYREAEELVASSWGPSLVVRAAALVGRQRDWTVERTVAAVAAADSDCSVQVLHVDDLVRFLVCAVESRDTGVVEVATDPVPASSARRWLGVSRRPPRRDGWPGLAVALDTTALHQDWDFQLGWTAAEALADTGQRGVGGVPVAEAVEAVAVVPREPVDDGGEFDDPLDPGFPMFSAWGITDALPGPLTPVTLDVQVAGLRAGHLACAELLGLDGDLADEWCRRAVAVCGHRLFTGLSVCASVAAKLPRALHTPAIARRLSSVCRHYQGWTDDYAGLPAWSGDTWSTMTDAALDTRILVLRDRIQRGWALATIGVLAANLLNRPARSVTQGVPLPSEVSSTSHLAEATARVAALLRQDPRLRDSAAAGDVAAVLAACAPIDDIVGRVGHRGPGEAELANPVIADSPGQLLVTAAVASDAVSAVQTRHGLSREAVAARLDAARQRVWDTTMRNTHQLRMALREKGRRWVTDRTLADADDIWYLTVDELVVLPQDIRLRVKRRRAERERLQAMSMPHTFCGQWSPLPDEVPAPGADHISGHASRVG
jgi:nucleoside-diphosphate-sugar epimerase